MGSSSESNQLEEKDSPSFPRYEIQNLDHDDLNDGSADSSPTGMAQRQWDRSRVCDDAECNNCGWNHPRDSDTPSELVHLLPCRDNGKLVGEKNVSIDD